MSRARSLAWLVFAVGLASGWLAGAWTWTRWAPFSAVRLAQVRAADVLGGDGWAHATDPDTSGGALALRPVLETVLASAVISGVGQSVSLPADPERYMSVQLVDARGVTLDVLAPDEEWTLPASLGDDARVWCLARARVLPGEDPSVARAIIEGIEIEIGPARGD